MNTVGIGIIGAGRMGRIRGLSAKAHRHCRVVAVVDTVAERARSLAAELGCDHGTDPDWLLARNDVDAVVVSTPHKYLAWNTCAALEAGKYVFCEKPGARTPAEAESYLRVLHCGWPAKPHDHSRLTIGFTLRHHPAVSRARELLVEGVIGEPMYVRGRYGHGGRPGYDQEWRGSAELAGGGELLDQGVHLIDLSRWFLGEFVQVSGRVGTFFWGASSSADSQFGGLEDNAFLLLSTKRGTIASLHASWTQWKNMFSFEAYGSTGSLQIDGLGGYYGPERLIITRRKPEGGVPDLEEIVFNGTEAGGAHDVWAREWAAFIARVLPNDYADSCPAINSAGGIDAWQALRIVESTYRASANDLIARLDPWPQHVEPVQA